MMKNKIRINNRLGLILLTLFGIILLQCNEEPDVWEKEQEMLQIMEYIEADSANKYSEFLEISQKVEMDGILSTRGPFTLFLAANDAFQAFYESKGKSSYNDFSDEELRQIIRNHVVAAEISTNNFGNGSLSEKNAIGDYLVTEFDGSDIIINKYSKVIDRDIQVANGIIHQVDKVIDPVVQGTYTTLNQIGEFSIFTKALELAGLKDTLDTNEIPYGLITARVRYTILAIPDSIFKANGIYSAEDLVAKYDNGVNNIDETDNGFYEYMVYHCLEKTYYQTDINSGIYWVISRNNYVNIEVGNYFYINPSVNDTFITTFIDKYSNIPTKNGVIHAIDHLLPVVAPIAREFKFDACAYPEFEEKDYYGVGETVRNFYDGENDFAKIKWKGDYLQYWCKFQGTGFINEDCITMPEGFWELEVTMPRVTRGNYEVYFYFKRGGNRGKVVVYIDGVKADHVIDMIGAQEYVDEYVCDVNWTTTQEHVVRIKSVYPGIMMWDRLTFVPKLVE
ncbi:MAG: fasciclin domain-containing protein [Prolixibacteraceae bacterium]|nr:fasciclin domain-containing protein [Prolixibacteraceae bacterium]